MKYSHPLRIKFFRGFLFLSLFLIVNASSCAKPQVQNDFYKGLYTKNELHNNIAAVPLFENALSSSNVFVRQAACEELIDIMINMMMDGGYLSPVIIRKIKKEADKSEASWAAAFNILNNKPDNEKALSFFLMPQENLYNNAAKLYNVFFKQGNNFNEDETLAINGHFAISRLRYNEALFSFRKLFFIDGKWPQEIPALLMEYPALINDLGRAFQYTASSGEGLDLFLNWENLADNDIRYRLLFYAARIARQREMKEQAVSLFERALPYSPDSVQTDACIWYILDLTLDNAGLFYQKLERLITLVNDESIIEELLDKYLQILVSSNDWEKINSIYNLFCNRNDISNYNEKSRFIRQAYSYVIAKTSNQTLMQSVYEAGNCQITGDEAVSLYYRLKSSVSLDLPFFDLPPEELQTKKANSKKKTETLIFQFLSGFFENNTAKYSLKYIKQHENNLFPDELRSIAQSLSKNEMYLESIRLVSLYINKEGYTRNRIDMELMYPRPYRELVEMYTAQYDIPPALLFALIRAESAFQQEVVSSSGAVGLTQLMPATAQEMAARIKRAERIDYAASSAAIDLKNPAVNIHIGSYYLSYLMERFNDTLLSVLAYNGGMNRVRRWNTANKLPPDLFLESVPFTETRNYGRKVTAAQAVYEKMYYENP